MPDATVTPAGPVGMITLRGAMDVLGPALEGQGLTLPGQRMRTEAAGRAVLWMSPDELLVTCAHGDAPALAARLTEALGAAFATVAVVSDARAVFDLTGGDPAAVLARLVPADLAAMAPDEVRRTRLAQVAAAAWREGGGWRVVCFRSVSDYVEALLRDAAA